MGKEEGIFHFKRFDVAQNGCAMKVGTDGVLLGAWASCTPGDVLDIGTGTGLLALMMAQRLSQGGELGEELTSEQNSLAQRMEDTFHIDAVEIDPSAAACARRNFDASPWGSAMQVYPCALAEYETERSYGAIVCNPPFYNATLKPDDAARAMARHKDSLSLTEIMSFASRHLRPDGRLSLVYPADYDTEVMQEAVLARMRPARLCRVYTKVGKPCKRLLAEFIHVGAASLPLATTDLYLRDADGAYTDAYRALTEAFYVSLR